MTGVPPGPAVRVEHLSKVFRLHQERRNSIKERVVRGRARLAGTFRALDDVTFEVPRGQTIGLIGHNGSGKSTLLKILAGVYRPTTGSVLVDGRVSALLELGAGFHPELTGRENIRLNGAILGMSRRQIEASMDAIVDFSGLGEFIDSPVKIYSSGMYVRLGFAIAVNLEPEILIVDEIIAVGDEEFQRKCFDHLFRLRTQGTTIVLVTHSMPLAAELCDIAVWLDHGQVRGLGPARDVVNQYLAEVNQQEASKAAEAGEEPAEGLDTVRSGSGAVRVTDVQMLGADDLPAGVVRTGDPLTLRLRYEADEPLESVNFSMAFAHENGTVVASPTTLTEGPLAALDRGRGHVDYRFDHLSLLPATWLVSTTIRSHAHTHDQLDRAFELPVRSTGAESEAGMVRLDGHWSTPVAEPEKEHEHHDS